MISRRIMVLNANAAWSFPIEFGEKSFQVSIDYDTEIDVTRGVGGIY